MTTAFSFDRRLVLHNKNESFQPKFFSLIFCDLCSSDAFDVVVVCRVLVAQIVHKSDELVAQHTLFPCAVTTL